jgi:uncharacterized membrane protein
MAHDHVDCDELGLTRKVTPRMESLSSRAALHSVLSNRPQPVRLKNRTIIVLLVISNVLGYSSLSRGLHDVGPLVSFAPWSYLHALLNPLVVTGVALLMIWLISQLSLLSRVDLSYVLPVTSISYVLTALMGKFLLHEPVSTERWIGIGLIVVGVSLVTRTVPRTAPVLSKSGNFPNEVAQ